jgi:16S rRNA processing protein RimM
MKIAVAHIRGPRGFKGELAVIPYKPDTESLREGLEVTLKREDNSSDYIVESVKFLRDRIAVKLTGIDDEQTAMSWKGGEILIAEEKLAKLDEGAYYHFQIEGCEVYEESGKLIGIVTGLDFLTAQDILTVKTEKGETLIPFTKGIVIAVNVDEKKIIIKKVEGLY